MTSDEADPLLVGPHQDSVVALESERECRHKILGHSPAEYLLLTSLAWALRRPKRSRSVHACGVLHRDVKPANLLLDADASVWIADFGLAHVEDASNLTQTQEVIGTLRYLPPESLQGKRADAPGDIYGLGLTLYELLVLQPAFTGLGRLRSHPRCSLVQPGRSAASIGESPRIWRQLSPRRWPREPELRYQTASELASDLSASSKTGRFSPVPYHHGSGRIVGREKTRCRRRLVPWRRCC